MSGECTGTLGKFRHFKYVFNIGCGGGGVGGGEKVQGVAMGERWMIRLIEVMKRHFFFKNIDLIMYRYQDQSSQK